MEQICICLQWRNEHLRPKMMLFSVGNGALNAPRYWQLHGDALNDVETSANTYCFSYPYV
jgi:hypothetical protein